MIRVVDQVGGGHIPAGGYGRRRLPSRPPQQELLQVLPGGREDHDVGDDDGEAQTHSCREFTSIDAGIRRRSH